VRHLPAQQFGCSETCLFVGSLDFEKRPVVWILHVKQLLQGLWQLYLTTLAISSQVVSSNPLFENGPSKNSYVAAS
jgi:hypothetical protein